MESSYEFHSNGNVTDPSLQIVRPPSYQLPSARFSLHWFDTRVFYVRISNFMVDDTTPECLTLNHIPICPDTVLEVNGARCSMESQGISCILRRDRVDKKSEEATFVSTDSIRFTGSVKFEVFHKEDVVISGVLEMSSSNGCVGESHNSARKWCMNCESVISAGTGFLRGKQIMGSESSSPEIEVYVAGSSGGTPVILTKSVQLNHRKKHRKGVLDSIPENDASQSHEDFASGNDLQSRLCLLLLHSSPSRRHYYKLLLRAAALLLSCHYCPGLPAAELLSRCCSPAAVCCRVSPLHNFSPGAVLQPPLLSGLSAAQLLSGRCSPAAASTLTRVSTLCPISDFWASEYLL